ARKAVDLVDEQHLARLEVGEDRRDVGLAFHRRSARDADADAELVRADGREARLPHTRRAVQRDVLERLLSRLRRLDEDAQVRLQLLLIAGCVVRTTTWTWKGATASGQMMPFASWLVSMIVCTARPIPMPYDPNMSGFRVPSSAK